jgi:hypothetical protein
MGGEHQGGTESGDLRHILDQRQGVPSQGQGAALTVLGLVDGDQRPRQVHIPHRHDLTVAGART